MARIETHYGQGLLLLENVVLGYLLVHFWGTVFLHLLPLVEILRGWVQGRAHILIIIVVIAEVAIRFLVVSKSHEFPFLQQRGVTFVTCLLYHLQIGDSGYLIIRVNLHMDLLIFKLQLLVL